VKKIDKFSPVAGEGNTVKLSEDKKVVTKGFAF
jgi:hypothetical protein